MGENVPVLPPDLLPCEAKSHFMNTKILGVGTACIDLLIEVDEAFLRHVPGAKGGAEPIELEALLQVIEKSGKVPILATGGSSANVIKGLASLGEKCALLSHLGKDPLGDFFLNSMEKLGIEGLYTFSSGPTARVLCLITPDGERTMRFCMQPHSISDQFLHSHILQNVRLVHHEAYSLNLETAVRDILPDLMGMAKKMKIINSLDLPSFEVVEEHHSPLAEILKQTDIVFANEEEAKAMMQCDPEEGCFKLQKSVPIAIVLMGKEGCLVGHQGKVLHVPTYPATVIDTTGAGDLFASGFLFGYLHDFSMEESAKLGHRLASAVVEVAGTNLPPEKWKEIKKEISKIKKWN
jgi:sugar/nucleoside kinase (ribokinase family)